jgi:amino acid adenylation domain-containing protein
MASLHDRLVQLTPAQRQQLLQKLAQKRDEKIQAGHAPEISDAQQRMWLLHQVTPHSPAYNRPCNLTFSGPLDVAALERSLNEILRRHEVLRTNFVNDLGEIKLQIRSELTLRLEITNVRDQEELQTLAQAEAQKYFQLDRDPLIRAQLLCIHDREYILLLTFHHIIFDGWSESVFKQELTQLYQAFSQDQPSPLSPLPIQYSDFAHWQRNWLKGDRHQTQLDYWVKQLQDLPPLLTIPTDRPRPAVHRHRGDRINWRLDIEQTDRLKRFSQDQGCTLFMTLLASFQVLLSRYSGQSDIAVGTPIANRVRPELENLIGYFANTIILRSNLADQPSFTTFLQRVKATAIEAYAHQDIAFDQLITALNPDRDLSFSPLFQVMFGLQPSAKPEGEWFTTTFNSMSCKFDLEVNLQEKNGKIAGFWQYNTDLFDRSTIQQMSVCFTTLLEAILTGPETSTSQLSLMEKPSFGINATSINATIATQCIHELFEQQVTRTPQAIALQSPQHQLTYAELNHRANQLARYLQTLGIGSEVKVGVLLDRSPELIITLLAVLKAGGCYVPIDTSYPPHRVQQILQDAEVALFVTPSTFASAPLTQYSTQNLGPTSTAQNLAYIIYTSGSTGQPKGVMIEHRALATFCQSAMETYQLSARDRVLQFSSIGFDAAVEEIYPCWLAGGTVVLRTDAMMATSATFLQYCQDWQISVLDLPTAYWQQLITIMATSRSQFPPSVRLVIIGGEQVNAAMVNLWFEQRFEQRHQPALINTYGPTETTVVATAYTVVAPVGAPADDIPIGSPLPHTQTYILDKYLNPVPPGVVGELYLGGNALARGYLNQPETTAAAFIPNPFGPGRLYKTGDLVRDRAHGNLQYLGRIDQQIKIRGFRVEVSEVETALLKINGVQAAAIIAQSDQSQSLQLIAYVVLQPGDRHLTPATLKQSLRQQLPSFMVPSTVILLPELPLTRNGKLDRQALPTAILAPDQPKTQPKTQPRNKLERQLLEIWQQSLGRSEIGIDDNFFDLGGHSLLAMQIIAQIEQQTGLSLGLNQLFQTPTISAIAQFLIQPTDDQTTPNIVPMRSGDNRQPLFLIHAGGPSVLFYQPLVQELQSDRAIYGIESAFLQAKRPDLNTIELVAQEYLQQIRALQPQGPYHFAGSSFGGIVAYEMAQQLQQAGERVAALILFDRATPLDRYYLLGGPDGQTMLQALFTLKRTFITQSLRRLLPLSMRQWYWRMQGRRYRWARKLGLKIANHRQEIYCRHIEILESYMPKPYSDQVCIIRAQASPKCEPLLKPDLGWSAYAKIQVWVNSGGHMSMFDRPHVELLAQQIDEILTLKTPFQTMSAPISADLEFDRPTDPTKTKPPHGPQTNTPNS